MEATLIRQGRLDKTATKMAIETLPFAGNGVNVAKAQTAEAALKLAGLDWTVSTGPIFDADMKKIEGYKGIYRSDNNDCLGVSGNRFVPIQNAESFAIAQTLLDEYGANVGVAGHVKGGRNVWAVLEAPDRIMIAGEEHKKHMLMFNAHTGRLSLKVVMMPHRTACYNIVNPNMRVGKKEDRIVVIRHTENYDLRVQEARKVLQFSEEYFPKFQKVAQGMAEAKFSKADFEKMVGVMFPKPEPKKSDGEISKRAITNWTDQVDGIMLAYNMDNLNNIRETKYGAFNAMQWYSDKGRAFKGDALAQLETAFLRPVQDTKIKDEAFAYLIR